MKREKKRRKKCKNKLKPKDHFGKEKRKLKREKELDNFVAFDLA